MEQAIIILNAENIIKQDGSFVNNNLLLNVSTFQHTPATILFIPWPLNEKLFSSSHGTKYTRQHPLSCSRLVWSTSAGGSYFWGIVPSFRNCLGEYPLILRKTPEKYSMDEKPVRSLISVMERSVLSRYWDAAAMRASMSF